MGLELAEWTLAGLAHMGEKRLFIDSAILETSLTGRGTKGVPT